MASPLRIFLKEQEHAALQKAYREDSRHCVRVRCHVILLKSDGERSDKEIASIVGMCAPTVNSWTQRYRTEGIEGLYTKPGRGRKPKLSKEEDQAAILEAVKENRQSIKAAKAAYERQRAAQGKEPLDFSEATLISFLKALTVDIRE